MEIAKLRYIHAYCGMPVCGGPLKCFEQQEKKKKWLNCNLI